MIIIAAMSADRLIGAGDQMPWNVPEEYEHFLRTVRGQTIIMGRRSYEIFGPDLDDCQIVALSRSSDLKPGADGKNPIAVCSDLPTAIATAQATGNTLFFGGGAKVYEQALELADEMHLSTIHGNFEGDTYFPAFDETKWHVAELEEHEAYTFRRYVRL